MEDKKLSAADEIMMDFAERTGLVTESPAPRRYLWTDAFAVCNFLELHRQTGAEDYKAMALRLVEQVHRVLGRHREEDKRSGWISGLSEEEGARHPTAGGLRIGKGMKERGPREPYDERLEWDRDGQYYHYLAKWMHALNRVSRATGNPLYNEWAVELAKAAHARFVYQPSRRGPKRMYWKMSIDLSRALVTSMGQHDPLDGLITYRQLEAAGKAAGESTASANLDSEIADMVQICKGMTWDTDDPLGIGGLLCDAYRWAQLTVAQGSEENDLLPALLESSLRGLGHFARGSLLVSPADERLAFRELGLSIGLKALQNLQGLIDDHPKFLGREHPVNAKITRLMRYQPLCEGIEKFWLDPASRKNATWEEHREINMVMLATSLAPDGFLSLA
ncbi:MAG: hypothetical protein MUC98_03365 [Desulfobacterota bacterium]|nr:hypothetical protein [Thermodesulfobacteriota bacterium]